MCLVKTHKWPKITLRPKLVYKVLEIQKGVLSTPHVGMIVKLGETIKAKKWWNIAVGEKEIWGEGVHAYVDLRRAETARQCGWARRIFIAEIPVFTLYWMGDSYDIAAKRMKIIKELEGYD